MARGGRLGRRLINRMVFATDWGLAAQIPFLYIQEFEWYTETSNPGGHYYSYWPGPLHFDETSQESDEPFFIVKAAHHG